MQGGLRPHVCAAGGPAAAGRRCICRCASSTGAAPQHVRAPGCRSGRPLCTLPLAAGLFGGPAPMAGGFTLGPKAGVMQMGSEVQAGAAPAKFKVRCAHGGAGAGAHGLLQAPQGCGGRLFGRGAVQPLHCCWEAAHSMLRIPTCSQPRCCAGHVRLDLRARGGGQPLLGLGVPQAEQPGALGCQGALGVCKGIYAC